MSILLLLLLGDSIVVTVTITIFHELKTNVVEPVPFENSGRLFLSPALGYENRHQSKFLEAAFQSKSNETYPPIPLMV